jgi:glutathione S-transferase
VLEWVGYVSTEIHKAIFAPIFTAAAPEEAKAFARALAERKLPLLANQVDGREFVVGDRFTVADAYLIWALNLCPFAGIPLDAWPALQAYLARMQALPSVKAAMAYEQERLAA